MIILKVTKKQSFSISLGGTFFKKPHGGSNWPPSFLWLTEKQQKYQHYYPEKVINMNILQAKKYYLQIKEEWHNKISFHILLLERLLKNKQEQLEKKEKQKEMLLQIKSNDLRLYLKNMMKKVFIKKYLINLLKKNLIK